MVNEPLMLSLSKYERCQLRAVFPLWFDRLTMSGKMVALHHEWEDDGASTSVGATNPYREYPTPALFD